MNTDLFIKRLGVGALLLVPLAPLAVYTGFLFPYTSGRNFFFRALALVACAAWLLLWVRRPASYKPRASFLSWVVLAGAGAVSIATALAPYSSLAFWSSLERMDGLVNLLFLAAFFFAALNLLDAQRWKTFFHISLGTALVESVVALLQLAGVFTIHQGGVRVDATFGNASFFAAYLLLSAGLALFLSVHARGRWRVACALSTGLFIFLALMSGTRSAFLALPVALLVAGVAAYIMRKEHRALRRFGIISLVALLLFSGLFFTLRRTPLASYPLVGRLLSISLSSADAQARFLSWGMALRGAAERPLFGWGPEGFRAVFVNYYDPRLAGQEQWFDRAHNNYLDWLVATGGIGLLAYLALWFGLVRALWRRGTGAFSAWEKVALSGALAGYAAFNLFSFDTITASILFFSFLAFVNRSEASSAETRENSLREFSPFRSPRSSLAPLGSPWPLGSSPSRQRNFLAVMFSSIVILLTLFVFYFVIAKPALAARYIYLGLQSSSPDLDTHLGYFTRAISLHIFATPEAREMLAQFAVDVADAPLKDESRKKVLTLVVQELTEQIATSPGDPRYLLRLGATLNAYRVYADAVPFLEQAVALSPNKQPSLYELGTSYLNLGRFGDAVTVFKHAAELLPLNQDVESKILYVTALVYARDFPTADAYMGNFPAGTFDDSRLADAYRRVGQSDKARIILIHIRQRTSTEPDVPVR